MNEDLCPNEKKQTMFIEDNGNYIESDYGNDVQEEKEKFGEQDEETRKNIKRKISIEYIDDRGKRQITFSKRKAGLMKKAYELSILTGTQVLLLVANETGNVYTYATQQLQPIITRKEGRCLIQNCLNKKKGKYETNQKDKEIKQTLNRFGKNPEQLSSIINKQQERFHERRFSFQDRTSSDIERTNQNAFSFLKNLKTKEKDTETLLTSDFDLEIEKEIGNSCFNLLE